MLDKAECFLLEKFQRRSLSKFLLDKLVVNLHLSFPVRSISRGTVIGIALTRNQSRPDVKTLSSLLKLTPISFSRRRCCCYNNKNKQGVHFSIKRKHYEKKMMKPVNKYENV